LPFGNWPATPAGMNVLKNYVNPEGKPLSAIEEAYNADEAVMTPSVFSTDFDRMSLPRITATDYSIDWVVSHKDEIPTMASCKLGPTTQDAANDPSTLQALISAAVQSQACPDGVYHVGSLIFVSQNSSVGPYTPAAAAAATATNMPAQ